MYLVSVFVYEIFAFLISGFVAWHYMAPDFVLYMLWAVGFFAFNSLFIIMIMAHKPFFLSREITLILSFLLAFIVYLTLFFIINDLLLFIPFWGQLYFSCPICIIDTATLIIAFISGYAVWNTQNMRVVTYTLYSEKCVSSRIVFMSDLHVAPNNISVGKVRDIILKVQELNPDFFILGGDIIEMRPDYFTEYAIVNYFKELNFPYKPIGVLGNHEYYGGQVQENIEAFEKAGIVLLRDGIRDIPEKNITFIGRDDQTNNNRLPLDRLMKLVPKSRYKVVIDHDPLSIPQSVKDGIDLQISGHTHNGQLFPFNYLTRFIFQNAYGLKKIKNTDTIVSSGIGTWGPALRLGTHSELVLIEIRGEKECPVEQLDGKNYSH